MNCIICKQEKCSGRACLFSSAEAADETINYLLHERQETIEPLFVCRDCMQSILSKARRRGYLQFIFAFLILMAMIAGLIAANFVAEAFVSIGIVASLCLFWMYTSLDIIRHTNKEKYVHQVYHYFITYYQKKRPFKKSFRFDKTLRRRQRAGRIWFEVSNNTVGLLGYTNKQRKKMTPGTDIPETRQAKEAAVGELINKRNTK